MFEPLVLAGQSVQFQTRTASGIVRIAANGIQLLGHSDEPLQPDSAASSIQFVGADHRAMPVGDSDSEIHTVVADLSVPGPPRSNRNTAFQRLKVQGLYPGIDLACYGRDANLEFDFIVHPGADPKQIDLQFDADAHPSLSDEGDLLFRVNGLLYRQRSPVAFQYIDGEMQAVEARYVPRDVGRFGIALGAFRHDQVLVIDPVLEFASYVGPGNGLRVRDVFTDKDGHIHFWTESEVSMLPDLTPPENGRFAGPRVYQVLKLDYENRRWLQRVIIRVPGDLPDFLVREAITVGEDSSIYGFFTLPHGNIVPTVSLPGSQPPPQVFGGLDRIYLFRFRPDGSLAYLARVSCNGFASAFGVLGSPSGELLVAGTTGCTNFPVSSNAHDQTQPLPGSQNPSRSFLLKLAADGSQITGATFIGGSAPVINGFLARDHTGAIAMGTLLSFPGAPTTSGVIGHSMRGVADIYLARYSADLSQLEMGTYVGGDGEEALAGIHFDPQGNMILIGLTRSPDFPLSLHLYPGYVLPPPMNVQGGRFIARLRRDGQQLDFAVFLKEDIVSGFPTAVDSQGRTLFVSRGGECPPTSAGPLETWCVARLAADGSALEPGNSIVPLPDDIRVLPLGAERVLLTGRTSRPYLPASQDPVFPTPSGWHVPFPYQTGWFGVIDFSNPTQCSVEAQPNPLRFSRFGGVETLRIVTQPGCPWSLGAYPSLHVEPLDLPYGIGPAEVRLRMQRNPYAAPEEEYKLPGSPEVFISHEAARCEETVISESALHFGASGGEATLVVERPRRCPWATAADVPWLSIHPTPEEYGSTLDGSVTLTVRVGANAFAEREATLTVAGFTVPLTQQQGGCTATLSPAEWSLGSNAATISFDLTTSAQDCVWEVFAGTGITVQGASTGAGSRTITVNVAANPFPGANETFLYLAGTMVRIRQQPGLCVSEVNRDLIVVGANHILFGLDYAAQGTACGWQPTASVGWIRSDRLTGFRTGSGALQFSLDVNSAPQAREGIVTNLNVSTRVVQAGTHEWLGLFTDNIGGVPITVHDDVEVTPFVLRSEPQGFVPIRIPQLIPRGEESFDLLLTFGQSPPVVWRASSETSHFDLTYWRMHRLNVITSAGGEVLVTTQSSGVLPRTQFFRDGEQITLEARPAPGFQFVRWEAGLDATAERASFTMDAARTVIARFLPSPAPPPNYAEFVPSNFVVVDDIFSPLRPVRLTLETTPAGEVWTPGDVRCEISEASFSVYRFSSLAAQSTPHQFFLEPTLPREVTLRPGQYLCQVTASKQNDPSQVVSTRFTVHIEGPSRWAFHGEINATTNAASFSVGPVVPGSIFTVFGMNLADTVAHADALPLPLILANTSVLARSAADEQARECPLFFASPLQLNVLLPEDMPLGSATLELYRHGALRAIDPIFVSSTAPGVFKTPDDNSPAVTAVLVQAESQRAINLMECGPASPGGQWASCVLFPPSGWRDEEELYVSFYATGIGSLEAAQISVRSEGTEFPVVYAGPQGHFAGLDQINVLVPRSMRGRGAVSVEVQFGLLGAYTGTLAF